ncbi:MAG: restriction endonuclease subunit S, partial [Fusobacteriaceae bacterium]
MRAEIKKRIEQIEQGIVPKGYKETKVGIIPEEWEVAIFGDIYNFKSTNSYSRDNLNYETGEVKNIHYGDIHTKFKTLFDVTKEIVPFINEEIFLEKISNENYCKNGDLVIADASENYADIGKSLEIININNQKILAGLHTLLARPNLNNIKIGFGAYLMKVFKVNKQIKVIAQGTKVLSISTKRVAELKVILPPLQEQKKLVSILTQWDSLIEEQEKLIEEKRESFKVTQTNLLYGRKRFKCFSETNETFKSKVGTVTKDKSWKIVKIKSFFKTKSIRNCGSEELLSVTQDRGVIPRTMLEGNVTMPEGTEDNYKFVEKGNFIISLRSFQGGVEYSEYRGLVSPAYTVIEPIINIDDSYYKYLFKNTDFINRMSSAVVGIRDGKQINFKDFGELYIQLPPLEEQQKISQF